MSENKIPSYYRYWGKTAKDGSYHLLPYHCLDVAAVGTLMLQACDLMRRRLASVLSISEESVTRLCAFFLAIHDMGKFAEAFQNKRPDLRGCLYGPDRGRQSAIRHDNLGYLVWKDLWGDFVHKKVFGFGPDHPSEFELEAAFGRLACCAAGHHGYPARSNDGNRELSAKSYFSIGDMDAVFDFCADQWQMHVGCEPQIIESLTDEDNMARFSWWLAGLLVVCDWVGSDDDIFGYVQNIVDLEGYWSAIALPKARVALDKCGLSPSKPCPPLSLGRLAGEQLEPTPLQELCGTASDFIEPQLWILEDITGAGKTEAAMLLVNRMMAAGQADGFYIGLPTMATADGMYRRMADCYRKLFTSDQSPSLILAHGSRHLSDDFRQSIISISTSQMNYNSEDSTGAAQCLAWLADNRKKSLLADAGVGTVDQALLAILPSRHQSLRLFGLGSKVLLVDEVHAHDAYVNQLLKRLLIFQAHIGGSVVLLSATLPQKMRWELAEAYQIGLGNQSRDLSESKEYPLVTVVKKGKQTPVPVQASRRSIRKLPVRLIHDEKLALDEFETKSSSGQCACWIRNTVWDARTAYCRLIDEQIFDPSKIMLFHARFTLKDRLAIEEQVVNAFGRKSTVEDRAEKILIATQVVENSLNLCFDGMVSDLAPIDALIQRAGRQHRHPRDAFGNPLPGSNAIDQRLPPIFYILTPDPVDTPGDKWFADFLPKAAPVYPHVGRLWITARLLKAKGEIAMPYDLRNLIEGVYGDTFEPIPKALQEASDESVAEAMCQAGLGKYNGLNFEKGYSYRSGQWSEEIHVPTRLGEETHTVYLAKLEDGKLAPLKEGSFPWDLSSLRMSKKKLNDISPAIHEKHEGHIEKLIQSEKRLNKYDLILPVTQVDEYKWRSEGIDDKGNTVDILYDKDMGLMVGDEIRGG